MLLFIAGCGGVTPYQEADSKGYGVRAYRIGDNRYKVVVKAKPKTSKETAEAYFWRRSKDLCGCPDAEHGDLIFSPRIEGCLKVSQTIRSQGHPGKTSTKRHGGALSQTSETTEVYAEDTEVSGVVDCLKESK